MNTTTHIQTLIADSTTPVHIYQIIRKRFSKSILFESNTFEQHQNSNSIIVFDELAFLSKSAEGNLKSNLPDFNPNIVTNDFSKDLSTFKATVKPNGLENPFNGIYGFSGFNSVTAMDDIQYKFESSNDEIDQYYYGFFRYVLVFNHFKSELTFIENVPTGEVSTTNQIIQLIRGQSYTTYHFETIGDEKDFETPEDFMKKVELGKELCQKGEVFQIVLSRQFRQNFIGDEFNVYRTLRSLNPSPYLFFADFGNYKIFGSSPEAQIMVKEGIAEIHPIAGTYKKTGNDEIDQQESKRLSKDQKENAEHTMLVDLARNDLSRLCNKVIIKQYKAIESYSHVIHLVSKVEGRLIDSSSSIQLFSKIFPAGTLSGAPKINAIKHIGLLEGKPRNFYGGSIGYFGFNDDVNQAIIIRSICVKNNQLIYQAGAGVVVNSQTENELKEVDNKLKALRQAISMTEKQSVNTLAL